MAKIRQEKQKAKRKAKKKEMHAKNETLHQKGKLSLVINQYIMLRSQEEFEKARPLKFRPLTSASNWITKPLALF